MAPRIVVTTRRSARQPFAKIIVTGLPLGLERGQASVMGWEAVKKYKRRHGLHNCDARGFVYDPDTGRAVFV